MKWFQVLFTVIVSNNSIQYNSFLFTLLNGSKYCYLILIIQFLHKVKVFQVLLFETNNTIQHYSFIRIRLNGSKYCYVIQLIRFLHTLKWFQVFLSNTTLFNINHLFHIFLCHTDNLTVICLYTVKWFNISIWPIDWTLTGTISPGLSVPGSMCNEGVCHIPQNSRTGTSPINGLVSCLRHLLRVGSYPSAEMQSV